MQVKTRAAGVVVVRRFEDGRRFLVLRCFGYWDFPKGEVEPDEEPLTTARREVAEETGLAELDFRWGHGFTETEPYAKGKVARYYLAECPHGEVVLPVSPELGVPEHQEFRWVRADEAETLLNDRLRKVLAWATQRIHTSASA